MNEVEAKKAMRDSLEKLKNKLEIKEKLSKEKKVKRANIDQAKDEKKFSK